MSSDSYASPVPVPDSQHRTACFFHLAFKVSSILIYLMANFFNNFVLVMVTCVMLLAFDFWTVKNVTGRLLVGLRWWNEVKEDGTNVWIFESKPDNRSIHPQDSFIFWSALYITPIIWFIFGLGTLTGSFQYLLIVFVALTMSGANVVGYWKCQKDAGRKITQFIAQRL